MEHNVGPMDALARLFGGAVLGSAALATLAGYGGGPSALTPALGVGALLLLASGAMNTCGVYRVLGVDTT
ncbi:DUF2892 domain-containing protein [Halobacterium salinarum]|uniref:YgaP family membrane protein n=1 Tax=Halobacterium TaxID=2239 RepID=UPI0019654240|nr:MULTISPECIES: DUF2892 domain-containing protein [Halobacterium]MCF2165323.1 DUF2892 domain-containing protein [Halobacterium salinarum]MCF2167868.1 DUF2892 domain-containing protein [Halobacterium salinarum]MDL0138159.1 DUF2892 domain-containing protein [Halobacterium salinarum]QRY21871.1 DUF2892 domain-containing protein [Halobacterium sp. GSL-19]WJK63270.1 DUF2892 domain-containing protein [Halobacterium salinarum]